MGKGLERCLLGQPVISKINLLEIKAQNASVGKIISLEMVRQKYPNLFRALGTMRGEYYIALREGAEPIALSVPRRIPIPLLPKVKQELEKMERNGVISCVYHPIDWCSGMGVVPKPNNKIRIFVDLTRLNENVKLNKFPSPAVDQSLGLLSGAKYFSKIDLNFGFRQIYLANRSTLLTNFITAFFFGLSINRSFRMLGIQSSPEEIFQQWQDSVFSKPNKCVTHFLARSQRPE